MNEKKQIGVTLRLQSIILKLRRSKAYRTLEYFCKTFCLTRALPSWVANYFFELELKIERILKRVKALIERGNVARRQTWLFYNHVRTFLPVYLEVRRFVI